MNHHKAVHAALGTILAFVAGCASTPPSQFYHLTATSQPVATGSSEVVAVGPVSVPASVNRPQMVVSVGPNELALEEFQRWASPLQDEIGRALAGDLVALLGTPNVVTSAAAALEPPAYRVAADVQVFESQPGTAATLAAAWTVRRSSDGHVVSGRTSVRQAVSAPGFAGLAEAHSLAIGRLAAEVASAMRAMPAAEPARPAAAQPEPAKTH
jgi:uncharacterized lipoprotein YmbA